MIELHFAERMTANISKKRILGVTSKRIPLYSLDAVVTAAVCHEMAHIAIRGVNHTLVRAIEAEGVLRQIQKDGLRPGRVIAATWLGELMKKEID